MHAAFPLWLCFNTMFCLGDYKTVGVDAENLCQPTFDSENLSGINDVMEVIWPISTVESIMAQFWPIVLRFLLAHGQRLIILISRIVHFYACPCLPVSSLFFFLCRWNADVVKMNKPKMATEKGWVVLLFKDNTQFNMHTETHQQAKICAGVFLYESCSDTIVCSPILYLTVFLQPSGFVTLLLYFSTF